MQPKIKVEHTILFIEDNHGTKDLQVHDLKQLLGIVFKSFFGPQFVFLMKKHYSKCKIRHVPHYNL